MLTIYIAGPFRGDVRGNVHRAREAHRALIEFCGWRVSVICPHTMSEHMGGHGTDAYWLDATLELMLRCDAAFFLPLWERSGGARAERGEALRAGIPCFDTLPDLRSWVLEKGLEARKGPVRNWRRT